MNDNLFNLTNLFEDSTHKDMCKLVNYPDSLYDYIKAGRTFDDYIGDFEDGSLLNGKIVGSDDDSYLVSKNGHSQWAIIDLYTYNTIDIFSDESLILKDYFVKYDNLTDYYADKLVPDSIENIKERYNQVIYRLIDENDKLNWQLDYADDQLKMQLTTISELKDDINELSEKIISLILGRD